MLPVAPSTLAIAAFVIAASQQHCWIAVAPPSASPLSPHLSLKTPLPRTIPRPH